VIRNKLLSFLTDKKTSKKKTIIFIRGYSFFKKQKKIYQFRALKAELIATIHQFDNFFFRITVFFYKDLKKINLNLSLSQYIVQKMSIRKLNLNILKSVVLSKKIFHRMPTLYKNLIEKNYNHTVSSFSNLILWPLFCLLFWCYGNYLMLNIFFKSLLNLFKKEKNVDLFFFQIQKSNIPFFSNVVNPRNSYDLISWFNNFYYKRGTVIKNINHDNPSISNSYTKNLEISYSDPPYFFIRNIFKIFKFLFISVFLSFISLIFLIIGKWSPALLLNEIFKAISYIDSKKSTNLKRYLFHYSETIYRPIWTYFSDLKNAEIILYFYSTYDAPTDYKNKKINRFYEFGNISWSKILVWDENQKKILSSFVDKNCELIVTGPIWFRDKDFLFKKKSFKVMIFDMEVQRLSVHYGWGEIAEYNNYNKNLSYLFLNDIYNLFKNKDVEIILKRKRKIGDYSQTAYKNLILKLKKDPKFTEIDQDVSPQYLIENANIVISTPFTSANLYNVKKDIKNIYYDPISYVDREDPAARGFAIIRGFEELQAWEKNINYNL
jgi:polysaccharide biosynthesis PFTS motif protein